jgi:Protein of unknown function (DUF3103)
MMMKYLNVSKVANNNYLLIFLLLFLGACSQPSQVPSPNVTTPETIDASLESLAKLFAKATTDSSVRQHIQQQVAQRFDGDTEVLYTTLATPAALQAQSSSMDIRQALANAYAQSGDLTSQAGGALEAIDSLTNSIPRLQIAVPEQFDSWDAQSYTPLVGYVPAGIDDKTIKEIKAFDSEGNEHTLDARTPPAQPVIILSQNERTDDTGQLLKSENSGASNDALEAQVSSYEVKMGTVELFNDYEPWIKGDPEIWLIAQALTSRPELGTRQSFSGANSEDYRYVYDRYLGNTRHDVVFYWYEQDGSSYDISITVRGVTLGFKIDDSDDTYGYITAPHTSLAGTSSAYYDLGGLEFSAY